MMTISAQQLSICAMSLWMTRSRKTTASRKKDILQSQKPITSFLLFSNMSSNFTRYQKIIIFIFKREQTIERTAKALEEITGEKYENKNYLRDTIRAYRRTRDTVDVVVCKWLQNFLLRLVYSFFWSIGLPNGCVLGASHSCPQNLAVWLILTRFSNAHRWNRRFRSDGEIPTWERSYRGRYYIPPKVQRARGEARSSPKGNGSV